MAASLADEAARYYRQHESLIQSVLDEMVTVARPEPGEDFARMFGVVLIGMLHGSGGDPARVPVIATLAIMRLAGWVAES